jgi:hypothetical protein
MICVLLRDLTPSDFYLFDHAKACLAGRSCPDVREYLDALGVILREIEKGTLQAVFRDWMERLRKCIATNGDHAE